MAFAYEVPDEDPPPGDGPMDSYSAPRRRARRGARGTGVGPDGFPDMPPPVDAPARDFAEIPPLVDAPATRFNNSPRLGDAPARAFPDMPQLVNAPATSFPDMPPLVDAPPAVFDDMPPLVDMPSVPSFIDMPPLVEAPPERFHDMPPLVEPSGQPPSSMTFTFAASDMTPIGSTGSFPAYDPCAEPFTSYVPSPSPSEHAGSPSKGKRGREREPGYIPRPPNAFILFRASFIKSHKISSTGAGNASLSKQIGKIWRGLPREEREVWEQRALVAQAEHREKYPDWRFRPANAPKGKVKDGPGKRKRKGGSAGGEDHNHPEPRDKGRGKGKKRVREDEEAREPEVKPVAAPVTPVTPGFGSVPLTSMFRRSSSAPSPRMTALSPALMDVASPSPRPRPASLAATGRRSAATSPGTPGMSFTEMLADATPHEAFSAHYAYASASAPDLGINAFSSSGVRYAAGAGGSGSGVGLGLELQPAPQYSSYSSLEGWAGRGQPQVHAHGPKTCAGRAG